LYGQKIHDLFGIQKLFKKYKNMKLELINKATNGCVAVLWIVTPRLLERIMFLDFIHRIILDKVQKHDSFDFNSPLSERFRMHSCLLVGRRNILLV
jgi:hypothetical protein